MKYQDHEVEALVSACRDLVDVSPMDAKKIGNIRRALDPFKDAVVPPAPGLVPPAPGLVPPPPGPSQELKDSITRRFSGLPPKDEHVDPSVFDGPIEGTKVGD